MGTAATTRGSPENRTDVLVVDDEEVVRGGIRRILEAHGFSVAVAADAAAALEHPALPSCRLVLCDLVLPDSSGLDLTARLHRQRPDLPVVVITGYATWEQETLARKSGAAGFLAKPFDERELVDIVRAALRPVKAARKEKRP